MQIEALRSEVATLLTGRVVSGHENAIASRLIETNFAAVERLRLTSDAGTVWRSDAADELSKFAAAISAKEGWHGY